MVERQFQVVERQTQVAERRSGPFRLNLTTAAAAACSSRGKITDPPQNFTGRLRTAPVLKVEKEVSGRLNPSSPPCPSPLPSPPPLLDPDSPMGGKPDNLNSSFPSPSFPLSFPFPSPAPLFPFLPLEVGPLNTVRGSGSAGGGAEPQRKSNSVHFSLKI